MKDPIETREIRALLPLLESKEKLEPVKILTKRKEMIMIRKGLKIGIAVRG